MFSLTMRRFFLSCRGCIICPTLHFDKDSLDFGTTSIGKLREMILLSGEKGRMEEYSGSRKYSKILHTKVCVCVCVVKHFEVLIREVLISEAQNLKELVNIFYDFLHITN